MVLLSSICGGALAGAAAPFDFEPPRWRQAKTKRSGTPVGVSHGRACMWRSGVCGAMRGWLAAEGRTEKKDVFPFLFSLQAEALSSQRVGFFVFVFFLPRGQQGGGGQRAAASVEECTCPETLKTI